MNSRSLRLSLLLIAASILLAATASTALAGGTITGTVFKDYNANAKMDAGGYVAGKSVAATDTGVAGVTVKAYDASNKVVSETTTGADGTYALAVSTDSIVRIEFTNPTGLQPSFEGLMSGTSVQFAKAGAANVDYAVYHPTEYCQDNPKLITCLQPATDQMETFPAAKGIVTLPAAFSVVQKFTAAGASIDAQSSDLEKGIDLVAPMTKIGATFGLGVDRFGNAYAGTYIKRHSPYGPAGATNTIYRINLTTGAGEPFVQLGDDVRPAHSRGVPAGRYPPYSQDGNRVVSDPSLQTYDPTSTSFSSVYFKVGRAGIGDVDVLPDGSALVAVEMTETAPKLWRVPLVGSGAGVTAGSPTATPIAAPAAFNGVSCAGTWHPMGIGVRGDQVLVGGVCGGNETRFVNPATGRTEAAAFVLEARPSGTGFGFETIAEFALDYPKGGSVGAGSLKPATADESGLWNNWYDGATPNKQSGRSKPMVANIEIMDNGDLTLGFRDRFFDQVKPCGTVWFDWVPDPQYPNSIGEQDCSNGAAAELLRLCKTATGYEREQNGACNGVTGANLPGLLASAANSGPSTNRSNSPLYYGIPFGPYDGGATHGYTGQGGIGALSGSPVVWSTVYDPVTIYQQGLRAVGPCADRTGVGGFGPVGAMSGAFMGCALLRPSSDSDPAYSFYKGNGLGDLEIVCDAAPVQIGNRVWIDVNKDGIQEPNEPPVQGVTAHLYTDGGTLVGTALTDANGQYYFSSTSSAAAAGDGTNTGGGLTAGAAFSVKFDNAADYAKGGPLYGYGITTANVTKSGDAVNSKVTMVGGKPTIKVPARAIGENNHTYDAGFILKSAGDLVAIGDYTWVDTNRNGLQDEKPLKGVKVQLLTAKGKGAKNAAGKTVPVKTTNRKGYYVFDGLEAGKYRVRFILPSGYRFTVAGKGSAKRNSNPIPTKRNRLVGETPPFEVYAKVKGNTIKNDDKKVNASYIDPTIDAGVVRIRATGAGSVSSVTG
ncbi:MAG: SdrD B-like domain-containing protein [Gaiellales bacterium]